MADIDTIENHSKNEQNHGIGMFFFLGGGIAKIVQELQQQMTVSWRAQSPRRVVDLYV